MPQQKKDRWEKLDILLKPVGAVLTAFIVGSIGYFGSSFLEKRQIFEARTRLYAELMSKREDADSSLRKDMFNSIITTFLAPKGSANIDEDVLALELLAYNFHEALDIAPLFKHVYGKIIDYQAHDKALSRDKILSRLEKIARDVASKQIATLEEAGGKLDGRIDLAELKKNLAGIKTIDGKINGRHFTIYVLIADEVSKELRVEIEVKSPSDYVNSVFWVGFFDFPMIDNTRLSNGERCAIVLREFNESSAEITLVFFPGSRASLKEKPYYDEVINELLSQSDDATK